MLFSWQTSAFAEKFITRFAGDSTQGYYGDGGDAKAAQLNQPKGLTLDSHGNLYFADSQNHVIRKINQKGVITTIAGNNTAGYCCDGELATAAQLNHPTDVAIDKANNIYISDCNNHVIRKVDKNGIITTIAGDGTQGNNAEGKPAIQAQLSYPSAISLDSLGNLYISDYGNHLVYKVHIGVQD